MQRSASDPNTPVTLLNTVCVVGRGVGHGGDQRDVVRGGRAHAGGMARCGAVPPARSGQGRQPVGRGSADGWCQHATRLQPLRQACGDLVDAHGDPVRAP